MKTLRRYFLVAATSLTLVGAAPVFGAADAQAWSPTKLIKSGAKGVAKGVGKGVKGVGKGVKRGARGAYHGVAKPVGMVVKKGGETAYRVGRRHVVDQVQNVSRPARKLGCGLGLSTCR